MLGGSDEITVPLAEDVDALVLDGEKAYLREVWLAPIVTLVVGIFMNLDTWFTKRAVLPMSINLVFVIMTVPFIGEAILRKNETRKRRTSHHAAEKGIGPCVAKPVEAAGGNGKEDSSVPGSEPRLVIACAGGGIKSASFCIGALQQLDAQGTYARASHLVAVSGGGYAATAFSLAPREGKTGRILGINSPQLAMLRRRTNYLTDSPRSKFQLVASLLLGIVYGLMATGFMLFLVGSVVGTYARVRGDGPPSSTFIAFAPALLLLLVVAIMFLWDRFRAGRTITLPPTAPSYTAQYRLSLWSMVWILAVPGLMWAISRDKGLHTVRDLFNVFANGLFGNDWIGQAATALTALGTLLGLVGLSVRGAQVTGGSGGAWSAAWKFFRRWIAPTLALIMIALLFYAFAASMARLWFVSMVGLPPAAGASTLASRPFWVECAPAIVAGASIVGSRLGNANRYTLHVFYRERLGWAFIGSVWSPPATGRKDGNAPTFEHPPYRSARQSPNSCTGDDPADADVRPELVLCATATVLDVDRVPTGRSGAPFVFSHSRTGFTDTRLPGGGCVRTPENFSVFLNQPLSFASAMAISGAAVSPISGRETRAHAPFRILMALCNVRLGVWIRNPYWVARDNTLQQAKPWREGIRKMMSVPAPGRRFAAEAFGRPRLGAPVVYLTDGGHYDNLGLVESLRLRPSRIILLDGSGDARDRFTTIGRAIAVARIDLGVDITLDPRPLRRGDKRYSGTALVTGWATWPKGEHTCRIDYLKSVLPRGMSWDVESYRIEHPDFPETSEQLEQYDEFDFEAFRQLGYSLAKLIPPWRPDARSVAQNLADPATLVHADRQEPPGHDGS